MKRFMTYNPINPRPFLYAWVVIFLSAFHGCIMDEVDNGPECFSSIETLDASGVDTSKATLHAAYALSARQGTTITEAGFILAKKQEGMEAADPEWHTYHTVTISADSLHLDLTNLEPETEYVYSAFLITNNDQGTINGEYKYFTTGALPQISTVTTEGVIKQGDHLYSLHASYYLADKHILSGMGFKYWITSMPETVYDQEEAIKQEENGQFTEQITVFVLDVGYSYYAYITLEGSAELITGDTLAFTPNSQTVVTTEKYEITAPGVVELYGSYILGGNSVSRETGFYLWKNEELLGAFAMDTIPEDGSIYLETDFIEYEQAFYQFMAYVKHADESEATGEKLDIIFIPPGIPEVSEKPTIDDVYDTDTEVTGTGIAGSEITIIFPSGANVTALVDKNNRWKCDVPETLIEGQIIKANQTEPDKLPSEYVFTIVLARGLPQPQSQPPVINEVYNTDTEITGTGIAGAEVTVIFPAGTAITVPVSPGKIWRCNVPASETLVAGQTIYAYQTESEKLPSVKVQTIVLEEIILQSAPPTIDDVYTNHVEIAGTGIAGSAITVIFDNGTEVTTLVDTDGTWRCAVPSSVTLIAGGKVKAYQTEAGKQPSEEVETIILEVILEKSAVPHINDVYEDEHVITGTGISGSEVTVIIPSGATITMTVYAGEWSCIVKDPLIVGDLIYAHQTEVGKSQSDEVGTVVKEREEKSDPPTINMLVRGMEFVTGRGKPGSTIKVTFPDGSSETTLVNGYNDWGVPTPAPLQIGEIVKATQKEPGKSVSDEVQSKVSGVS
ncbi:MAG: hypothetical protein LUD74_09085 [Tannerellaceae bacterium]|nr:hypothetical protein [Tannerellaceae bacterium]